MKIHDISHSLSAYCPNWEGSELTLETEAYASVEADGYYSRRLRFDEHASTHLDAPAHIFVSGATVDQIAPERLHAPLSVVDFRGPSAQNPDAALSLADLERFESAKGPIDPGSIVLLNTGWARYWRNALRYRNADDSGVLHFPGFSLEAAQFLVDQRRVLALGIDTLSADCGADASLPVHHYCLERDVYLIENTATLDRLPPHGATLIVAPLKLENGSAAPVRLFALSQH